MTSLESLDSTNSRLFSKGYNNDPLFLQNSYHPAMQLVSNKLNGTFQHWSRAVKIALRTKVKLGFTYGSCPVPDVNSPNYSNGLSVIIRW